MDNLEKNTYVKNQIKQAMINLLKEKEFTAISISEITETAMVSRNSFYRNYSQKEDIIREYLLELLGEWTADYDKQDSHSDDEFMVAMFHHMSNHKDFYMILNERHLLYLLKNVFREIMGPKPEYPNIIAYSAAFIVSGIYGWVEEWLNRGMQESADEMAELLKKRNSL